MGSTSSCRDPRGTHRSPRPSRDGRKISRGAGGSRAAWGVKSPWQAQGGGGSWSLGLRWGKGGSRGRQSRWAQQDKAPARGLYETFTGVPQRRSNSNSRTCLCAGGGWQKGCPRQHPLPRLRSVRRVPEASTLRRCGQGELLSRETPSLGATAPQAVPATGATEASTARNKRPGEQLPVCPERQGPGLGKWGVTKDRGHWQGSGQPSGFTWGS